MDTAEKTRFAPGPDAEIVIAARRDGGEIGWVIRDGDHFVSFDADGTCMRHDSQWHAAKRLHGALSGPCGKSAD